ncbi:hypothetical protein N431DRAFT_353210 [Stipitochalara longipes BDJ]|nr:hypothetical protein N431DRAFT_353210 [Stipitochalara longipes BDJ]
MATVDFSTTKSRLQDLLESLPKLLVEPQSKTFTCFPKLPIELRIRIWNHACRVPQKVKLRITINDYSALAIRGGPKTPAPLHVCFESRKVALQHYTLCRQILVPGSELLNNIKTRRRSMYVNFEVDNFRIMSDSILRPRRDILSIKSSRPSYRYTYNLDILKEIRFLELEVERIKKPREHWRYQIIRLWTTLGISQSLQHLKLVHLSSPWAETRKFKGESVGGHMYVNTRKDKYFARVTTLLLELVGEDVAEARPLRVDVGWDILTEVEFCPTFTINGECCREKGEHKEEGAEYRSYLKASGLL